MLLDYRSRQPGFLLRKLQERQFSEAPAKMQWWYFDILLRDGGVLVAAFMPRKWWRDTGDAKTGDAFLFASIMPADKKVRSFRRTFDASRMRRSKNAVEIPDALSILYDENS